MIELKYATQCYFNNFSHLFLVTMTYNKHPHAHAILSQLVNNCNFLQQNNLLHIVDHDFMVIAHQPFSHLKPNQYLPPILLKISSKLHTN